MQQELRNTTQETIESVIRGQRRIKGSIVSMDQGKMRVASELGEFPFVITAIKENKRVPGRVAKAGDKCDFKLSDTNPVKATSIRVIVPRLEIATANGQVTGEAFSEESNGSTVRSGPISAQCNGLSPSGSKASSCLGTWGNVVEEGGSGIDKLCSQFQRAGVSGEGGSLFSNGGDECDTKVLK